MQESKTIQDIFNFLNLAYGSEFERIHLEGRDQNAVKEFWAKRLEYWLDEPYAIDWALENLPARCPNVIEFKQLCKQAPKPQLVQLPAPQPKPTPERLAMIERLVSDCMQSPHRPLNERERAYRAWQKLLRGETVSWYLRDAYKKYFKEFAADQKVLS